jgi:hypothetical protein
LRLLIRGSDKQYRYQKRSVKKRKIPKILMPAENGFRPENDYHQNPGINKPVRQKGKKAFLHQ